MTDEKDKAGDEIEFLTDTPPAAPGGAPAADAAKGRGPEEKAEAEPARPHPDKLKKKDAEIKQLRRELDELKDAHLRRLADTENLRKRFEREKADFQQYALSGLMLELLTINDNFERALQSAPPGPEGQTLREGVELIQRMLQGLLAKNGVRPIALDDRTFDPNIHHAMIVEESDQVAEPTVAEELQKGYLINDRLLRPTLVKVLVPKKGS